MSQKTNQLSPKYYTPAKDELWVPIKGYEDYYEISNKGRIRRISYILKAGINKDGYLNVALAKNGKNSSKSVHRLVAEHFLENSQGKPVVNHIDGNKYNPEVSNLEWTTYAENTEHAHKTGLIPSDYQRGIKNNSSRLDESQVLEIKNKFSEGWSSYRIQKELFPYMHYNTINNIKTRKTWAHLN